MVIQHNIAALNAYRQLNANTTSVSKNLEKLSSGYAINRAGDDASGLAISEKMRAQISGLQVAQDNAQDGISLVQTAEGALTEVHSMLNRAVELAEKSANGTIQDDVDREAIQKEANDLISEIDRISKATNFNGIQLLDGNLSASSGIKGVTSTLTAASGRSFSITAAGTATDPGTASIAYTDANGDAQSVDLVIADNATVTDIGTAIGNALTSDSDFSALFDVSVNGTSGAVTITDKTVGTNTGAKHGITSASITATGATAAGAQTAAAANSSLALDLTSATFKAGTTMEVGDAKFYFYDSSITDEDDVANGLNANKDGYVGINLNSVASVDDVGTAIVAGTGSNVTYTAGTDVLNVTSLSNSSLPDVEIDGVAITSTTDGSGNTVGGLTLQIGDSDSSYQKVTVSIDDLSSTGLGIKNLDLSTQEAAANSIQDIKDAINKVSTNRGNLGGLQNRLEYTINNLSVTEENMTAAESNIRDVDMASEMMTYTKNNVLTQAAQAMLAQANTQPQSVLQLLQ